MIPINQEFRNTCVIERICPKFEERYKDILKDWTGALQHFKDEENTKRLEDIFKED